MSGKEFVSTQQRKVVKWRVNCMFKTSESGWHSAIGSFINCVYTNGGDGGGLTQVQTRGEGCQSRTCKRLQPIMQMMGCIVSAN